MLRNTYIDSTVDFDLLGQVLATMQRLNENKQNSYANLSVSLSLVPGVANEFSYHENLARVQVIANSTGGVVSQVLLDLSSIVVGPLDGFSLTQELASCNEVGSDQGFKCGIIVDFEICKERNRVFDYVRFPKSTHVYFSLRQTTNKNLNATYQAWQVMRCFLEIQRRGFKHQAILDDENIIILKFYEF